MEKIKFRVWCRDKNEWEKDLCFLSPNGILCHADRRGIPQPLRPENHIMEIYIGVKDVGMTDACEGDIVRFDVKPSLSVTTSIVRKGFHFTTEPYTRLTFDNSFKIIGNIHDNPDILQDVL